jgi:hypothetical protein
MSDLERFLKKREPTFPYFYFLFRLFPNHDSLNIVSIYRLSVYFFYLSLSHHFLPIVDESKSNHRPSGNLLVTPVVVLCEEPRCQAFETAIATATAIVAVITMVTKTISPDRQRQSVTRPIGIDLRLKLLNTFRDSRILYLQHHLVMWNRKGRKSLAFISVEAQSLKLSPGTLPRAGGMGSMKTSGAGSQAILWVE